jgi:hypothetical protein
MEHSGYSEHRSRTGFVILLILFAAYAAAFISRTSFEVQGTRYFCLFDDAMISMRYARNLAHGLGLVWNPGGERVEGFTNPLWVMYMALLHLLPFSPPKISLAVQVSGAACLLLTLYFVREICSLLMPGSRLGGFSATVLTAFYVPLVNWSLQGMEVGILALLVTAAIFMILRGWQRGETPPALYLVLATGTFVRMDFAPLAFVLLAALVLADRNGRRRHLVLGGGILLLALVIQTLLRYAYYGELLPNTYFLKMLGIPLTRRLGRGVAALLGFAGGMTWVVFLVPLLFVLIRPARGLFLLGAAFLTQCAYSVYVGGDAWEWWGGSNRYISVVMPLFFILFGSALSLVASALEAVPAWRHVAVRAATRTGFALAIVLSYFQLNNVRGSVGMEEWVECGSYLITQARGQGRGPGLSELADAVFWLTVPTPLESAENRLAVQAAVLIDSLTTPEARILVAWAGAIPYFSDRKYVDLLGKNDRLVARLKARETLDPKGRLSFVPGHSKWSYAYSIGELKPDVVFQLWAAESEAHRFLDSGYYAARIQGRTWYFRRGSQSIRWETVERLSGEEADRSDGSQVCGEPTCQNASLMSKYIPLLPPPNPASTLSVSFSFRSSM